MKPGVPTIPSGATKPPRQSARAVSEASDEAPESAGDTHDDCGHTVVLIGPDLWAHFTQQLRDSAAGSLTSGSRARNKEPAIRESGHGSGAVATQALRDRELDFPEILTLRMELRPLYSPSAAGSLGLPTPETLVIATGGSATGSWTGALGPSVYDVWRTPTIHGRNRLLEDYAELLAAVRAC